MDASGGKGKRPNLIVKTWERCKSIGRSPKAAGGGAGGSGRHVIAPEGCFSVYVGPQRQRFVIRAEYANHPLFKNLLEEAESEFGYTSEGPLVLPCDTGLFQRVLVAMDHHSGGDEMIERPGCVRGSSGYPGGGSPYRLLSPPRIA